MATISDLPIDFFKDKAVEEAHELLRTVRASRRTPPKKKKAAKRAPKKPTKKREMTKAEAIKLLEIIESTK